MMHRFAPAAGKIVSRAAVQQPVAAAHRSRVVQWSPRLPPPSSFLHTAARARDGGGGGWEFDASEFRKLAAQDAAGADDALARMAADGVNLTPALLGATFYGDAGIVSSLIAAGCDPNALIYDGWDGDGGGSHGHGHSHGHNHGHSHGHSHGVVEHPEDHEQLSRPWSDVESEKEHEAGSTTALYRPEMRTVEANATPAELARLESLIHGVSALCIASQAGATHVARVLIEGGADAAAAQTDSNGLTFSLGAAAEFGHVRVLQMLLDNGADPEQVAPANGESSLCIAASHGYVDVTLALLDAGASPYRGRRLDGATPLWIAAQHGRAKLIPILLDAIATTTATVDAGENEEQAQERRLTAVTAGVEGISPRVVAELGGHSEVAELLSMTEQSMST